MENWFNVEKFTSLVSYWQSWFYQYVATMDTLIEFAGVLLAAMLAWFIAPRLKNLTETLQTRHAKYAVLTKIWQVFTLLMLPVVWLLLQWVEIGIAVAFGFRHGLLTITASLLSAWVVIRFVSSFVRDPVWSKTIATVAWVIAALNILGLLDQSMALLDGMGVTFGNVRISVLTVIKGVLALAVMLWLSTIVSNIFESRIRSVSNLTPSVQVLFTKLVKITLVALAFVAAISAVGIDLTVFAVFGGAIGVGIGFGLQKIVANLISGVILLLDDSIRPGDTIAVADYYGRVDSLGARYVSVMTRDGIEHLIPNEELITTRVENWSHSHDRLRLRVQVGVHYKSDVHLAIQLCLDAAGETNRILADPAPNCLLRGFGDSSVDLEIRYWIKDPMNGRANVTSEMLLKVWDKFHEHGIEIPYPQRDLHLRTPEAASLEDVSKAFSAG